MSKLATPDPLTREMIGEVMDMGARAKGWLRNLPWAQAEAGMREVDEMIATVSECLPGGFFGHCEGCGSVLGNEDDLVSGEDATICRDCADRYEASLPTNLPTVTPEQEPVEV